MKVDLVWLDTGSPAPPWDMGKVRRCASTPASVRNVVDGQLSRSDAEAWLFWDPDLGSPNPDTVRAVLDRPGDAWHAGLRLGMAGLPRAMDHVVPLWMLNRDPDPTVEATSWRLSFRAVLVRTAILRAMGPPTGHYRTLAASALDYGHRCIRLGALCRHVPDLVPGPIRSVETGIPVEDELLFVRARFGSLWAGWAALRAVLTGAAGVLETARSLRVVSGAQLPPDPDPVPRGEAKGARVERDPGSVTVLIPTVDRYPYLATLLEQLGRQTVRPREVIVVDQTPPARRRSGLKDEFPDLPLRVIEQDTPGQCTSRNAGLQEASGELVLFIDDDDEIGPTLIEDHLATLDRYRCEASSGVAHEVGAGSLPEDFTLLRASDVFPTNNTMVRIETLQRSGLFDLAYDRSSRADGDLGMRVYLSGALMILNPEIAVLHHHAPSGGLRTHKARVVTYASSRSRIFQWHIPSTSQIYLGMRYYSPRQVQEALRLAVLGTFRLKEGGRFRKALKVFAAATRLPISLWQVAERCRTADRWFRHYPQIPPLERPVTTGDGR